MTTTEYDEDVRRIPLDTVLRTHSRNEEGICTTCLGSFDSARTGDYEGETWPCTPWLLARRAQLAEEQLALLPQRGRDVLRGFHEGANDLGPRPSPQTAPRPPHPADWGVAPEPDFGRAIGTGQTPRIGSFDDDVVDAEIIED